MRHVGIRSPLAIIATIAFSVTLLTVAPGQAHAAIEDSNTFSSWTPYSKNNANVTEVADTAEVHSGKTSLKITDASAKAADVYGGLVQTADVTPSTTYNFSAWVKVSGAGSNGALEIVMSPDWSVRHGFAGGTTDWQKVTWTYSTTASQNTLDYRILTQDVGTFWLDDLTVTGPGSSTNVLSNPGFEDFDTAAPTTDPTLAVTTPVLVFQPDDVAITVKSNRPSVRWRVDDVNGQAVSSGELTVTGGSAILKFTSLDYGYYGLTLAVDPGDALTKQTSFAVLPVAAQSSAADGFGISTHLTESATQMDATQQLGAAYARFDVSWTSVELTKGEYTFSPARDAKIAELQSRGIRPLVILDYHNQFYDNNKTPSTPDGIAGFASYAAAVATHYGSGVDYEVYNEFNGGFNDGACGPTADCYFALLKPTYEAIKAAAPGATVAGPVTAGIDPTWLERLFQLGGLSYLDAVSVHRYDNPSAPEGLTDAAITQLVALIKEYNSGNSKPVWLSEYGWNTSTAFNTDAEQARYIVRGNVLNKAAGLSRAYLYDLIEDGTDPTNKEHRFGILRNGNDGLTSLAPKQGYVSYAILTRELAGYTFIRTEDVAQGAYAYVFTNAAGDEKRVLWATTPQNVTVTNSASSSNATIDVTSMFGTRTSYDPTDGAVQIALTGDPVYVSGAGVAGVSSPASMTYSATAAGAVAVGESFTVNVDVDHTNHPNASPDTVTFRTDAGDSILVPSRAGELTAGTLTVSGVKALGETSIGIAVVVNGKSVATLSVPVDVVDNQATLTVAPSIKPAENARELAVSVANRSDATALTVQSVDWSLQDATGSVDTPLGVEPDATGTLSIPVGDVTDWTSYDYSVTVHFSDGIVRTNTGKTSFSPVYSSSIDTNHADLSTAGTYIPLQGSLQSPSDLGGTMWLTADDAGVVVHAHVTDDIQNSGSSAANLWQGDSIQFAFAPGLPASASSRQEFGAALLASGTSVYRFSDPVAPIESPGALVTRDDATHTTGYSIPLTWEQIGIDPDADVFSYSFVLNDSESGIRKGYFEWGSGIGKTKDPGQYLPVQRANAADLSDNAQLASLSVDSGAVPGFDPETTEYTVSRADATPLPVVAAVAADAGASLNITQASAVPGTATVQVTAADDTTTQTYTIAFSTSVDNEPVVTASARSQCVNGTAQVAVYALNSGSFATDIRLSALSQDKKFTKVAAGKAAYELFDSGDSSLVAGKAIVTAYVPEHDGHAAGYSSQSPVFDAIDCSDGTP